MDSHLHDGARRLTQALGVDVSDGTGRKPVSVKRFDWERRLIEADLPLPTKAVALICATYASPKGQRIFPGEANLARQCHSDVRSVRRHLARLRESGYLTRVQTGSSTGHRNYADLYWLTFPAEADDVDTRTASPTQTGQNHAGLPDRTVRPTDHGNSSDSHRSASLTLAHDKSRADEDALAEDIRQGLETWSLKHHSVYLDMADEQYIIGMVTAGVQRRVIENTIKKRIREAEEQWRALVPVELAEASGAPF